MYKARGAEYSSGYESSSSENVRYIYPNNLTTNSFMRPPAYNQEFLVMEEQRPLNNGIGFHHGFFPQSYQLPASPTLTNSSSSSLSSCMDIPVRSPTNVVVQPVNSVPRTSYAGRDQSPGNGLSINSVSASPLTQRSHSNHVSDLLSPDSSWSSSDSLLRDAISLSRSRNFTFFFEEGREVRFFDDAIKQYSLAIENIDKPTDRTLDHLSVDITAIYVNESKAREINQLLFPTFPASYLPAEELSKYIGYTWNFDELSNTLIHRPSFSPNTEFTPLVATLVMIGMKSAEEESVQQMSLQVFPHLSSVVKSFMDTHNYGNEDTKTLSVFQSLAIQRWFAYKNDLVDGQYLEALNPKKLLEGYKTYLFPVTGCLETNENFSMMFKYGKVCKEGYVFFDSSDDHTAQWKEWVAYESWIRCSQVQFSMELGMPTLGSPNVSTSLFDADTVMPCPSVLWTASSANKYFAVLGQPKTVPGIPFFYLLKSFLRLPPVARSNNEGNKWCAWPISSLTSVLFGLNTIAIATSQNSAGEALNRSSGLITRLQHSFDKWSSLFGVVTGLHGKYHPAISIEEFKRYTEITRTGYCHSFLSKAGSTEILIFLVMYYHASCVTFQENINHIEITSKDMFSNGTTFDSLCEVDWWQMAFDNIKGCNNVNIKNLDDYLPSDQSPTVIMVTQAALLLGIVDKIKAAGIKNIKQWNRVILLSIVTIYLFHKRRNLMRDSRNLKGSSLGDSQINCDQLNREQALEFLYQVWVEAKSNLTGPTAVKQYMDMGPIKPELGRKFSCASTTALLKYTESIWNHALRDPSSTAYNQTWCQEMKFAVK